VTVWEGLGGGGRSLEKVGCAGTDLSEVGKSDDDPGARPEGFKHQGVDVLISCTPCFRIM